MGTVVAVQNSAGNQRDDPSDFSTAFERSSITTNLDWDTRHGNDPAAGNPNFNRLLIPDVGAAPVFEFQLLISLVRHWHWACELLVVETSQPVAAATGNGAAGRLGSDGPAVYVRFSGRRHRACGCGCEA